MPKKSIASSDSVLGILVNIRSIHNVASMFRTADGAGIKKLYLVGITPGPLNQLGKPIEQFAKVSLGAEERVPWEHVRSFAALAKKLKRDGYQIYAIEQSPRAVLYTSASLRRRSRIAFVMGEEVKGLSAAALTHCDEVLEIPMRGTKESLNVSVAFGIAAYELTRGTRERRVGGEK